MFVSKGSGGSTQGQERAMAPGKIKRKKKYDTLRTKLNYQNGHTKAKQ